MSHTFTAMQVSLDQSGARRELVEHNFDQLPPGDVLVRVRYSSLNYKDALSANGNKGVTRNYPHTPGIDAAGEVVHSDAAQFKVGDAVLVTGYDLGMNTPGGFAEAIRVPADWLVPMPDGLDAREAMVYGTAGFTAALAVAKIVASCKPHEGEVVVSGARGGVAGIALALLARLGYKTVAATRDPSAARAQLEALGVSEIISNDELIGEAKKPLMPARWVAGLDTVGGEVLAGMLKSASQRGLITCCGNAASIQLPISVFPFILRGVTLAGVDSQHAPMQQRREIWRKLAGEWKLDLSGLPVQEVALDGLDERITAMLEGRHSGRTLVRVLGH